MDPLDLCLAPLRFPPGYSGPGIRFKRYEPGFRDRGVRMRVFAIGAAERGRSEDASDGGSIWSSLRGNWLPPEELDGIPVRRMEDYGGSTKVRSFLYGWNVARFCERTSPDVLHTLSATPWNVAALHRIRRMEVPIIYTQTMVPDLRGKGLRQQFYDLAYNPVNCIVVSSSVMRSRLESRGVDARIEVIPNGVDLERFYPPRTDAEKEAARGKLGLPRDGTIVLFVGGALVPRKGVDVLAEAWSSLARRRSDLNLVLLGREEHPQHADDPRYKEFLRNLKRTLRPFAREGRVHYPGMVDNVEEYMRASDIFVFPSHKEGMPNVVGEAFACGLPSILTPFQGLPEEFGKAGREYRLVDRTPKAIETALSEFVDDEELRKGFAERARSWVERELDVEASLDDYVALYREFGP